MSAPIIVGAVAGTTLLLFEASLSIALLTVVPVGMWAKVRISRLPSSLGKRGKRSRSVVLHLVAARPDLPLPAGCLVEPPQALIAVLDLALLAVGRVELAQVADEVLQ